MNCLEYSTGEKGTTITVGYADDVCCRGPAVN